MLFAYKLSRETPHTASAGTTKDGKSLSGSQNLVQTAACQMTGLPRKAAWLGHSIHACCTQQNPARGGEIGARAGMPTTLGIRFGF